VALLPESPEFIDYTDRDFDSLRARSRMPVKLSIAARAEWWPGSLVSETRKPFENFMKKNRASEKLSNFYKCIGCFCGGIVF
jgi:hypothetical protein